MSDNRSSDSPRRSSRSGASRSSARRSGEPQHRSAGSARRQSSGEPSASPQRRSAAKPRRASQSTSQEQPQQRQTARQAAPRSRSERPAAPQARQSRSQGSTATTSRRSAGKGRNSRNKQAPAEQAGEKRAAGRGRRPQPPKKKFKLLPVIISFVLCASVVSYVAYTFLNPKPDEPTVLTLKNGFMNRIGGDFSPTKAGIEMDASMANPAKKYHEIFRKYWKNNDAAADKLVYYQNSCYNAYSNGGMPKKDSEFAAKIYSELKPYFKSSKLEYFLATTPKDYAYGNTKKINLDHEGGREIAAIYLLLRIYANQLRDNGKVEKYNEIFKNIVRLGYQASQSNASVVWRSLGFEMMSDGYIHLADSAKGDLKEKYKKLSQKAKKYKNAMNELHGLISARIQDSKTQEYRLRMHPGDVFNIAENHKDIAVRCEAIIMLGLMKTFKFHRRKPANIERATQIIEKSVLDSNEYVRNAANIAKRIKGMSDFHGGA